MTIRFDEHAYGLDSELLRHINRLVSDYDPNLSIRRIPNDDPRAGWASQQTPPHTHGVWELNVGHGVAGQISNWVFTFNEHFADDRIFARVLEGDMRKRGADERVARLKAHQAATELSAQRKMLDTIEQRRDEMETIGRLSQTRQTLRHTIAGEKYVLGDRLERVTKTHLT